MVKKGIYLEIISILWTLIEAGVAIGTGIASHSLALFAFGIDSIIELIAGFVLLWRLLVELKGQSLKKIELAEKIAAWVVGIALLFLALYIVLSALNNLYNHIGAEENGLGILLAILSGLIMPIIALKKKKIGTKIGSVALELDGSCSMVCAYMSWVLIIGVILTATTKLWWMDSVISLAFVYFIANEGVEAIEKAWD